MKITFIDSGVLVTAARGVGEDSEKALEILADSNREFAASEFIKMEVIPKAIYNRKTVEAEFYELFFSAVTYWANDIQKVIQDAYNIACQYGLAAMDALHIAAALSVGAEEFMTTEKKTKPMFRISSIKVISIFD
ncbi:type II toxin-antitoxin system VapC family toxin [Anabaena azotica]|uniref:PIN domain-containing protein n=1 Tax=Anabaena azotica FACHB-119 TaxID=947527 RepID=A0ABR8DAK9_9NOST|nr:PIN domain-containing protein [Anabaena azotica]MBD2503181.1 PIN domain-containing protein [Anabaena azotica FACHB-119]